MQTLEPLPLPLKFYGGVWTSLSKDLVKRAFPAPYEFLYDKFMAGKSEPKHRWDTHAFFRINNAFYPEGRYEPRMIRMYLTVHVRCDRITWSYTAEVIRMKPEAWISIMRALTLDEWK